MMDGRLLDLAGLKVYPLETRQSLTSVEEILIDPQENPNQLQPKCSPLFEPAPRQSSLPGDDRPASCSFTAPTSCATVQL